LWADDEQVFPSAHSKIMRLRRKPVADGWLQRELMELERLADDGDTLEVVAKLNTIVREPVRETPPAAAVELPSSEPAPRIP
jgi:hypothetical protein